MFPFTNGANSPISLAQNPTASLNNTFNAGGNQAAGLVVYPQPQTADSVLANVAQSGGGVGLLVTAVGGLAIGALIYKAMN